MATADVIIAIASAMFKEKFNQMRVWPQLAFDDSAEAAYGDSIEYPADDSTPTETVLTLTNAQGDTLANHQWPDPNVGSQTKIDLDIDQYYRINELIPTTHQRQVRPNIMQRRMFLAGEASANRINTYLRGKVFAAAAGQQLTAIAVSATNFSGNQAAYLKNLRESFWEASEALDYENMPGEGRVAVVSPTVYSQIEQHFETQKIPFQTTFVDGMTQNAMLMHLSGFEVIKDSSPGAGKTNADDDKHALFFMRRGEALGYAQQLNDMVAVDGMNSGSDYDGWLVRGRHLYGAALIEPTKCRVQKIAIS